MRTTTEDELQAAFVTQIRGITPSATMHAAKRWAVVDDVDTVQCGEIRKFFVELTDVVPFVDGIYSPASIEHAATCLVHTSYGGISRTDFRSLSARDGRQIYLTLATLGDDTTSNTIAGLVSVEYAGWQDEDTEQGRFWGAHVYAVRFLAPGIPGAS